MSRRCPIQLQTNCARGTQTTRNALPSLDADRSGTCTSPRTVGGRRRAWMPRVRCAKLSGKPADAPVAGNVGDPFMFQDQYADRSPEQIASIFGSAFAAAVDQVRPGSWQGPIESGLGWHLVFVTSAIPGAFPRTTKSSREIKAAWIDEQRAAARQRAFEAMKAHYEIRLPEGAAYCDRSGSA